MTRFNYSNLDSIPSQHKENKSLQKEFSSKDNVVVQKRGDILQHSFQHEAEKIEQILKSPINPLNRPKTPIHRTEQKHTSENSDCLLPTVRPSSYITEATVTFGSTYLKKPASRHFRIENNTDEVFLLEANLKPLKDFGFLIDLDEIEKSRNSCHLVSINESPMSKRSNSCIIEVLPNKSIALPINWCPSKIGKVRVSIPFRSKGSYKGFRLIIYGQVVYPPQESKSNSLKRSLNHSSVTITTQGSSDQLKGSKKSRFMSTDLGLTSLEFLEKLRASYQGKSEPRDLGWHSETNTSFSKWLNFILFPFDIKVLTASQPNTPGYFTYKFSKLHVRNLSNKIIKSESYISSLNVLSSYIENGSICFRGSCDFAIDIGARRELIQPLMFIEPLWLTLLLDTVFSRTGYFGSLLEPNLLEDLLMKCFFEQIDKGEGDSFDFEKNIIIQYIRSIVFLDQAYSQNLIPKFYRLFNKTSPLKSMNELLVTFKEKYLTSCEFPLRLSSTQTALQEIDLQVKDITRDLRDGVRLSHLVAFITNDFSILPNLQLPVINHQIKLDNVCHLFSFIDNNGINTSRLIGGPTKACDIVDGDRDKTLGLLWTIILWWQIPLLIDSDFFISEIAQLQFQYYKKFGTPIFEMITENTYFASPLLNGLLTWVASIAALFNLKVQNFTSSFSDGQVLCSLIGYYFPEILPLSNVRSPAHEMIPSPKKGVINSSWLLFSPPKRLKSDPKREAIRHNFELFKSASVNLGGVPEFSSFRINGAIDERAVILFVSHLAHRISEVKKENFNATLIQNWWRSHVQYSTKNYLIEVQTPAAVIIQQLFRKFISFSFSKSIRLDYIVKRDAAKKLQNFWRMHQAQAGFSILRYATISLQSYYRAHRLRALFLRKISSIGKIQSLCRGYITRVFFKKHILSLQASCIIQSIYRGFKARAYFNSVKKSVYLVERKRIALVDFQRDWGAYVRTKNAVLKIQNFYRRVISNRALLAHKESLAIKLQSLYRAKVSRYNFELTKKIYFSASKLQAVFKCHLYRLDYTFLKKAASVIIAQRRALVFYRRGYFEFLHLKSSTLFVQDRYRFLCYLHFKKLQKNHAALKIQSAVRRFLCHKLFLDLKMAVTYISNRRRALLSSRAVQSSYSLVYKATLNIQSLCKRFIFLKQQEFIRTNAAILIQSIWRGYHERSTFKHTFIINRSALRIQTAYRSFIDRKEYSWLLWATAITKYHRNLNLAMLKIDKCLKLVKHRVVFLQCRLRFIWHCRKQAYTRELNACVIQILCRSVIARRNFSVMQVKNHASVLIQSLIRRHLVQSYFFKLKGATVLVQQRLCLAHDAQASRLRFTRIKLAVCYIQAFWRLHQKRRLYQFNYNQLTWAATIVSTKRQQLLQTRSAHTVFSSLKEAVVCLQRYYRHYKLGFEAQSSYQFIYSATTLIQKIWRGASARLHFKRLRITTSFITYRLRQANVTRKLHSNFIDLKAAVIISQRVYRHYHLGFIARITFLSSLSSIRALQALCKGKLSRLCFSQQLTLINSSATFIQSIWRRFKEEAQYSQLRKATSFIISKRRASVYTHNLQNEYVCIRYSITFIQNIYRAKCQGILVRNHYIKGKLSVITIQAFFRKVKAREEYLNLKETSSFVTLRRQESICARYCRNNYLRIQSSVTFLQNFYRHNISCFLILSQFKQLKQHVILIQALWRKHCAQKRYKQFLSASIIIVERRHALLQHRAAYRSFISLLQSSIFIQTTYRKNKCAKTIQLKYTDTRNAIIGLQAISKGVIMRSKWTALYKACSFIVQRRREFLLARAMRFNFEEKRRSALIIQCRFRSLQKFILIRDLFLHLKVQVNKIQSFWRGIQARRQINIVERASNIIIQKRRELLLARTCYNDFSNLKSTTIFIQRFYRMHQLGLAIKLRFIRLKAKVITIQSFIRGFLARRSFLDLQKASLSISSLRRDSLITRYHQKELHKFKDTVIFLQKLYRKNRIALLTRNYYLNLLKSSFVIQAFWKKTVAQSNYNRLKSASSFIIFRRQNLVLSRLCKNNFELLVKNIIFTQRKYRNNYTSKILHSDYIQKKKAIVQIQSWWRAVESQRYYQSIKSAGLFLVDKRRQIIETRTTYSNYLNTYKLVVFIQNLYRNSRNCSEIRNKYLVILHNTKLIQSSVRNFWLLQETKYQAVLLIQAVWRKYVIQKSFIRTVNASITITSYWRMCIQRRSFLVKQQAVSCLQLWVRHVWKGRALRFQYQQHRLSLQKVQHLCRHFLFTRNSAASTIQSVWQSYKRMSLLRSLISHKRYIQSKWARALVLVQSARAIVNHFSNYSSAIKYSKMRLSLQSLKLWRELCIQRFIAIAEARLAEQRLSATLILQKAWRAFSCRNHLWAAKKIAHSVQALFHGYLVRKTSHLRVRKACRRIIKANKEAQPHMLLSNRTSLALEILSSSRSLTQIIHACEHLVVVTQLSSTCRQRLINQYHVVHVILDLMRTCNRSQPHQEILRHAVLILENIARDPLCAWGTYITPKEIDDIMVTMTTHKALRYLLDSLLVTLSHLLTYSAAKDAIKNTPKVKYHLKNVYFDIEHRVKHGNPMTSSRNLPRAPLVRFNYSVGLIGLSSADAIDPISIVQNIIDFL